MSVLCVPMPSGWDVTNPQDLAILLPAGLHEKAGTHSHFKIQCCANSVSSSANEGSFLLFLKVCLQHGFQSIFSIQHEIIDE